jgi:hypothetical protein
MGYTYDRRATASSSLTPEESKGIEAVKRERNVQRAHGKNPCASSFFGSRDLRNDKFTHKPFTIHFYAPDSRGQMRQYDWTGDSLTISGRSDTENYVTEDEANEVIRKKVLTEIRRYHPGDDVFILGW